MKLALSRSERVALRRSLGRHDRWSNPLLAHLPRRKRWTAEEADALLSALFDQLLRQLYLNPEHVERLVFAPSPLLEMLEVTA